MKATSHKHELKQTCRQGSGRHRSVEGIGASIAKHLAAEGAVVVVNYASSRDGADRVVAEITAQGGRAVAGALKNAIDFLFREWNNKAAGFVSYGGVGGARAVEQIRLVMAEVQIATVRNQVLLSLFTDFKNFSVFKPAPKHEKSVNEMFD